MDLMVCLLDAVVQVVLQSNHSDYSKGTGTYHSGTSLIPVSLNIHLQIDSFIG